MTIVRTRGSRTVDSQASKPSEYLLNIGRTDPQTVSYQCTSACSRAWSDSSGLYVHWPVTEHLAEGWHLFSRYALTCQRPLESFRVFTQRNYEVAMEHCRQLRQKWKSPLNCYVRTFSDAAFIGTSCVCTTIIATRSACCGPFQSRYREP
jgi:hypothetical protein